MTDTPSASATTRDDLTPRIFRALFGDVDLHTADGPYVVVPRGTWCLTGPSLGVIARQISTGPTSPPGPRPPGHDPSRPRETGPAR
jgi:hypothetical protein